MKILEIFHYSPTLIYTLISIKTASDYSHMFKMKYTIYYNPYVEGR